MNTASLLAAAMALGAGQSALAASVVQTYSQNFNGMAAQALPPGWTADFRTGSDTFLANQTSVNASASTLNGSSTGQSYKFISGADFAVGLLNSGSFDSGKKLTFTFTNATGRTLTSLDLAWNYEKYRSGIRAWNWAFTSSAGSGAGSGNQSYAADAGNTTTFFPPTSIGKDFSITGLTLANGGTITFTWTLNGVGGDTNGQALAVDDFVLDALANNNTTITSDAASVNMNRVMLNSSTTQTVALNKVGSDATTYTVQTSGDATAAPGGALNFGSGAGSQDLAVGVDTSSTGAKSGTVTVDNTATDSESAGQGSADANDSIAVSGTVVANRVISASSVSLGSHIVGSSFSGNSTLTTTGADDQNTRVTVNGSAVGADGNGVSVDAGAGQLFDDAADSVARSLGGAFTSAGAKSGSLNLSITGEGLAGEAVNNVSIAYTGTAFDPSNGSFDDDTDVNALTIDFNTLFGTINVGDGGGTLTAPFSIFNLLQTAGFTAGLDLISLGGGGDLELAVNIASLFGGGDGILDAGFSGESFLASLSTAAPGTFSSTITINVGDDAAIQGAAANGSALTLTLQGIVGGAVIPEPVSLMPLALGGMMMVRRRPRSKPRAAV